MKIESAKIVDLGYGYLALDLTIDGLPARILEPRRTLLELGCVALLDVDDSADSWSPRVTVTLAADPADGRPEPLTLYGVTDDPAVVALVRRYVAALDAGTLSPGPFA